MRGRLLLAAFCIAVATGCSGGSVNTTPVPAPVPTPTIAPAVSSIPLATTAPGQTAAPVSIPAPSGYAQTASVPFTNVPAGTTLAVTNSVGIPANFASQIPVLSRDRMTASSLRSVQANAGINTVLYNVIVPSNTVTASGASSVTFTVPAASIAASNQYYLGFYDSTVANPQWSTISGPVSPITTATGGTTLTFAGTLPSYTFTANSVYAIAVFSLTSGTTPPPAAPTASPSASPSPTASPSASPTPTPVPTTLAYMSAGSKGIEVLSTTALLNTIAVPASASELGMDDAGNMYVFTYSAGTVAKYALNSSTNVATYTPSVSNTSPQQLFSSGAGEVVLLGLSYSGGGTSGNVTGTVADIWDAGHIGGAPSRTLIRPVNTNGNYIYGGYLTHDGTFYWAYETASTGVAYDVVPAGASTASRTIEETIVPNTGSAQQYFYPNYIAVGADGTLYVSEWTGGADSTEADSGLYIYPVTGPERKQTVVGPQGIDLDGSGNVYVMVNNSETTAGPVANQIDVYTADATALSRTIPSSGWTSGYPMTVNTDGTLFFTTYGPNGAWAIPAGSTTATQVSPDYGNSIILYNGSRETTSRGRAVQSVGAADTAKAQSNSTGRSSRIAGAARRHSSSSSAFFFSPARRAAASRIRRRVRL
jgi:hypothetical protein